MAQSDTKMNERSCFLIFSIPIITSIHRYFNSKKYRDKAFVCFVPFKHSPYSTYLSITHSILYEGN